MCVCTCLVLDTVVDTDSVASSRGGDTGSVASSVAHTDSVASSMVHTGSEASSVVTDSNGCVFDANAPFRGDMFPVLPYPMKTASQGFDINTVAAWSLSDSRVMCSDCDEECSIVQCRMLAKAKPNQNEPKYRCGKCASTHTKIYRSHGSGMGAKMLGLPNVERAEFFQQAKTMGQKEIEQRVEAHAYIRA